MSTVQGQSARRSVRRAGARAAPRRLGRRPRAGGSRAARPHPAVPALAGGRRRRSDPGRRAARNGIRHRRSPPRSHRELPRRRPRSRLLSGRRAGGRWSSPAAATATVDALRRERRRERAAEADARSAFEGLLRGRPTGGGSPSGAARQGRGIYVVSTDGSRQRRLTGKWSFGAAWSPDGRRIAFWSARDGNGEVYVMNADGSGQWSLTRTRRR